MYSEHAEHNKDYLKGKAWPTDKNPLSWGTAEGYKARYKQEMPPTGKKLEAFIRFSVEADWRLGAPEPIQPSGDWIYDQRCLRAVTRTGTVPPPPEGKRRVITIRCYPDD